MDGLLGGGGGAKGMLAPLSNYWGGGAAPPPPPPWPPLFLRLCKVCIANCDLQRTLVQTVFVTKEFAEEFR